MPTEAFCKTISLCHNFWASVPKAAAGFWHWLKLQKSTIWARKIICVVFLSARLTAKQLKTGRNFYRGILKLHRSSHRANGFLIKMKSIRYWFRMLFLCANFRGDLTVTAVRKLSSIRFHLTISRLVLWILCCTVSFKYPLYFRVFSTALLLYPFILIKTL